MYRGLKPLPPEERRRAVLAGGYAFRKIKHDHPDARPAGYALVQRIVDGSIIFADSQSPRSRIGFGEDDAGRLWRAVWKTTGGGKEVLLVTLHRSDQNRLRGTRERHRPLLVTGG